MRKIFCKIFRMMKAHIHHLFEWCFSLHKYVTGSEPLKSQREIIIKLREWVIKVSYKLDEQEIREVDNLIDLILTKKEV